MTRKPSWERVSDSCSRCTLQRGEHHVYPVPIRLRRSTPLSGSSSAMRSALVSFPQLNWAEHTETLLVVRINYSRRPRMRSHSWSPVWSCRSSVVSGILPADKYLAFARGLYRRRTARASVTVIRPPMTTISPATYQTLIGMSALATLTVIIPLAGTSGARYR